MGSHHEPAEVDQHTLDQSKALWGQFTETAKYGVIVIAILLLAMWYFLV